MNNDFEKLLNNLLIIFGTLLTVFLMIYIIIRIIHGLDILFLFIIGVLVMGAIDSAIITNKIIGLEEKLDKLIKQNR